MGAITERMLDSLRVPCEAFPSERAALAPALDRACKHMDETSRPYAFVLRKGDVAWQGRDAGATRHAERRETHVVRRARGANGARPTRAQALRRIVDATPRTRAW
jgi:phosphonopyruvate decarboxylase